MKLVKKKKKKNWCIKRKKNGVTAHVRARASTKKLVALVHTYEREFKKNKMVAYEEWNSMGAPSVHPHAHAFVSSMNMTAFQNNAWCVNF